MAGAAPGGGLVVVSPAYCAPFDTAYVLQEKVFSLADSFDITDTKGVSIFKLQGKVLSLHTKKVLLDRNGHPVAVLSKKLLSLHGTWEIYSGDGHVLLASIKPKILSIKSHADVIVHQFGSDPYLKVKGDFLSKNFRVLRGDTVVATVSRKSMFKDLTKFLTGNDRYGLVVAANVDQAFCVALTVALDTMFNPDASE
eukprot:TRINITY_DN12992_c0_g1_i1.p1 TRINITY_DN12992_c0_g1~~TRINITY_DN12992_c0_g1_i1.p1  ORF type:complete len:207 (-),score=35.81 TRINITY_DN12992_c0_g1_i1:406-996(-)